MTFPLRQDAEARTGRMVAIVIAVTMLAWLGVQLLGAKLGWEARYVFLADLAAMAAFIWALVVTWRLWRAKSSGEQGPRGGVER